MRVKDLNEHQEFTSQFNGASLEQHPITRIYSWMRLKSSYCLFTCIPNKYIQLYPISQKLRESHHNYLDYTPCLLVELSTIMNALLIPAEETRTEITRSKLKVYCHTFTRLQC